MCMTFWLCPAASFILVVVRERKGRQGEREESTGEGRERLETSISWINLLLQCASLPLLPGGEGLRNLFIMQVLHLSFIS